MAKNKKVLTKKRQVYYYRLFFRPDKSLAEKWGVQRRYSGRVIWGTGFDKYYKEPEEFCAKSYCIKSSEKIWEFEDIWKWFEATRQRAEGKDLIDFVSRDALDELALIGEISKEEYKQFKEVPDLVDAPERPVDYQIFDNLSFADSFKDNTERIATMLLAHGAKYVFVYKESQDYIGIYPCRLEFVFDTQHFGESLFRIPIISENLSKRLDEAGISSMGLEEELAFLWELMARWVDAQLAMVDAGQLSIEEAFLPYISDGDLTLFGAYIRDGIKPVSVSDDRVPELEDDSNVD